MMRGESVLDNLNEDPVAFTHASGMGGANHHLLFGSYPKLRRLVRQAAEAAGTSSTSAPGVAGPAEPVAPAEPPGPPTKSPGVVIKEKVIDAVHVAKELPGKVVDTYKDLASGKAHFPIYGIVLIVVLTIVICCGCCYVLVIYSKSRWRGFKKSEKGREILGNLAQNPIIGRFVPEPGPDKTDTEAVELTSALEGIDETGVDGEEEEKEAETYGKINYKLEYDFDNNNLTVGVIQCKELPAMDASGTSDPYVKVFFAGDKKKKFETKVHRKDLNPQFNETFVFKNIPFGDVMAKLLMIQVFDFDRFGKHDQIGEVRIQLCQIDLGTPFQGWRDLDPPMDEDSCALGDICFSLRYVPTSGKLTISIIECKGLKNMDFGGASDPFVKIQMFMDGKKFMKKKTTVKMSTLNPYFNESFVFEVKAEQLTRIHFIVTVLDYDRIGTCDPIGRIAVGPRFEGESLKHWQEMINNPRRPIAQWHTLKDPDEYKEKDKDKEKEK